jgi:PRD1 phage membrane DNA delivery
MGEQLVSSVTTVLMAIVGVAILAVILSKQANTANVIKAGSSGFAQDLAAAVSPVTGSTGFGNSFTGGGVGFVN